jgi:hypothetical protein
MPNSFTDLARPIGWSVRLLLAFIAATCIPDTAWAHASEKGFVLLLPTGYYIAGGTLAVAASFLLLLFLPTVTVERIVAARLELCPLPRVPKLLTSGIAFVLLVLLLLTGFYGSRDPLENPLPLTVWTLWWAGLTIAHALLGNLWAFLNPWIAPYRSLRRLTGASGTEEQPPLRYPARLGYWPAALGFLAFAWFELVDPAPDDPARLAIAVIVYAAVTLLGMLLFGERAWLARAECFSVFFSFVAALAPFRAESPDPACPERRSLYLAHPGAALAKRDALPLSGVLFVLLTLATVSFDGLHETFWWLGLGGVNPLEFPGRTAVMARNSVGLVALWAALAVVDSLAIALGARLASGRVDLRQSLGAFVLAILPISLGYHFAHYLTAFLVNAQYAAVALSDPLERDWDLLGLGHPHITVSFLSNYESVSIIWKLQAAGVVVGHILAVSLTHLIAVARFGSTRAAMASQLPLAILMVGYTLFGLWLLATPTAG